MDFTSDDGSSDSDSDTGSTTRPAHANVVRVMPVMDEGSSKTKTPKKDEGNKAKTPQKDKGSKAKTPKKDENGNKLVFRLATESPHINPSIEMGDHSNSSSSSSDLPTPDFLKSPSNQNKTVRDFESSQSESSYSPASTSYQNSSKKNTPKSTPNAFSVLMSGTKGSTGKKKPAPVKSKGSGKRNSEKSGEKRPWPHVCDECGRHLNNAQVGYLS